MSFADRDPTGKHAKARALLGILNNAQVACIKLETSAWPSGESNKDFMNKIQMFKNDTYIQHSAGKYFATAYCTEHEVIILLLKMPALKAWC